MKAGEGGNGSGGAQKAGFEVWASQRAVEDLEVFGLRFFSIVDGNFATELSYTDEYLWKPRFARTRSIARATTVEELCANRSGRNGESRYFLQTIVIDKTPISRVTRLEEANAAGLTESESFYRKLELFGSGEHARGMFETGRHLDLLGVKPGEVAREGGSVSVRLEQPELFERVDLAGEFLPAMIKGTLVNGRNRQLDLAIVVNGTIQAVTRSFQEEDGTSQFLALVPEAAFKQGRNEIQILTIESGSEPRLRLLSDSAPAAGS